MISTIRSDAPDALARTVEVLAGGGVVVLPTDTVYGLATSAALPGATARLFALKGRAASVPVAVLCADTSQALDLASGVDDHARALAERHWPGPLTLVLPRRRDLGWALGKPEATIGLRCPDHGFVRAVAAAVGPLATTSANRHGRPTPPTAELAAADLAGDVDLIVDGGRLDQPPSTVVDATGPQPVILREGTITLA